MLAEYKYIEDEPEVAKPIASVRFKADYDITDVLRSWGNWSRKDYYSSQKTPCFYDNQQKHHKELCSDDDALLIDSALILLSKTSKKGLEQYEVLKLFYFGEEVTIESIVAATGAGRKLKRLADENLLSIVSTKDFNIQTKNIIKPLTVVDIAKKIGIDRAKVKLLKEGGENHILGHLSAITLLTGEKLALLNNLKLM